LHGYAERLIGDHSSNYVGGAGPRRGLPQGTAGPHRISIQASGAGQSGYQVHDEYVTASAVDFLNREGVRARTGRSREPFCLTVGFMLPHPPYVAQVEDFRRFAGRVPSPVKPAPAVETLHPHLRWRMEKGEILTTERADVDRARAAYWALVSRMDIMIGQILGALEANGFAENTLIVYSSDHGDSLGERGLWWKHTFYEESVKVPLILRWPGQIPAGQRIERVVSSLDMTATMLDALGAPRLPNAQGKSLLPLLDGRQAAAWDDCVFSEYCDDLFGPPGGCYQRMVRRGEWKLIYYHGEPSQLFNLAQDPGELDDRSADPACRDVLKDLTHLALKEWDPDTIVAQMQAMRQDNKILSAWMKQVQPEEVIRWEMTPDMEFLLDK
jgi:choline-sulfatase